MLLAIQLGLSVSMNPFVLSSTLGYVTLLSYWRHTRRELLFSGVIFIGFLWVTYLRVLLGAHDDLIYHPVFEKVIFALYIVMVPLWVLIGWFHLKACRESKEGGPHGLTLPRNVIAGSVRREFKDHLFLVFLFIMVGWFLSLCEARFTQNYYLLILLKRQMESGNPWLALASFVGYMAAYTIVLLASWTYCLISTYSLPVRMKIERLASLERIAWGALYWAAGAGLIYYLLKVVQ